ncbi:MAG TPA: helix-turn-helix domain-containing protein [Pilimelia sp.]|nr:helix-turn-helix domain-containing protein [Pilimelia sp.]
MSERTHDDQGVAAWAGLLKVHAALVPLLDRELQATHGLPLTWYDVLLELNAAPGRRLTMGQLGAVAVVSRTRVSRVVDELVRAGLVTREPNPRDARSAHAAITDAGRRRLRAAAPTYLAGIERLYSSHLKPAERATIATALGRVLSALGAGDPPATARRGQGAAGT